MMKNIAEAGGLQGRFLNHSLKKTTATQLRGMSEAQCRAQTGNRSSSLQNYEIVNDEDFRETSTVLYGNHTANRCRGLHVSQRSCMGVTSERQYQHL